MKDRDQPESLDSTESTLDNGFPIVGIGASAGGLKAFARFFDALPGKPGMAFVLIQHLDPTHSSSLAELLQMHTTMPVKQVEDRIRVSPGNVYVIPPGKYMTIQKGMLHLSEPLRPRGHRAPIDAFLRSLAQDQGDRAVCVILSGTGSDGSLGLKSIKEFGGIVMVQEPGDAEFDGMPNNALTTGLVDRVARAEELAQDLLDYHKTSDHIQLPDEEDTRVELMAGVVQKILSQLTTQIGLDFSQYKPTTILRRLKRRMQIVQAVDAIGYLALLRDDRQEAEALMKDFLISVTNFFRDKEAFETLEKIVIPKLFEGKGPEHAVRIWVPGCATGEEAYSIAMLIQEYMAVLDAPPRVQIFATDLDEDVLAFARRGVYPEGIAVDVSSERLERHFAKETNGYRVGKKIQELLLFAEHNLLKNPPFSKLSLISCRNLLMYLQRDVQQKIFQLFHYALNEEGYLFLGGSETADAATESFRNIDKKNRIYRRKSSPVRLVFPRFSSLSIQDNLHEERANTARQRISLGAMHRDVMLNAYAPPSVIVDENYDICYLFGDVGRYLRHREGRPSHNLLQLVPNELRVEIRTALFQVFQSNQAAKPRQAGLNLNGQSHRINLVIKPFEHEHVQDRLALIVFEPVLDAATDPSLNRPSSDDGLVLQLEDELKHTKHRLESFLEEYETSNEELKASNEELQSMNEELRSTSEELETSKEELQSTNEELQTVNAELKAKVGQLNEVNNDLENLVRSTHIGTLFLDSELRIKRFTPSATQLFNLLDADLGRPFNHITHKIQQVDLAGEARRVLETLKPFEQEVRGAVEDWYLLQMTPYRTLEGRINGVVSTVVDITDRKKALEAERERIKHQDVVVELRQLAFNGSDPNVLFEMAVGEVSRILDVDYAKVLELQPGHNDLLLRAGIGWKEGLVGSARVGTDLDSQAGYTLIANGPVIVEDLSKEKRFTGPPLLVEHGVVSGMSVVVQGSAQPFGVMGVHTKSHRKFSEEEAHFLQAVANVIGMATERHRAEKVLEKSEEKYRALFESISEGFSVIKIIYDEQGAPIDYLFLETNPAFEQHTNLKGAAGKRALELIPGLEYDWVEIYGRVARTGEPEDFILESPAMGKWFEVEAFRTGEPGQHMVALLFADITERKQTEEMLKKWNEMLEERVRERTQQVRTLVSRLTMAEQEERRRISQILHDDLQQLLFGIEMKMGSMRNTLEVDSDPDRAKDWNDARNWIDQAISTARQLSVDLSPPILQNEGLANALEWLQSQMHELHRIHVEIESEHNWYIKDEDIRVLLFQIVRELLFNVKKHANVDSAVIKLVEENNRLVIHVIDNGQGFDVAESQTREDYSGGFGLFSVKERLQLLGGRLDISSTPGEGTHVIIHTPVLPVVPE